MASDKNTGNQPRTNEPKNDYDRDNPGRQSKRDTQHGSTGGRDREGQDQGSAGRTDRSTEAPGVGVTDPRDPDNIGRPDKQWPSSGAGQRPGNRPGTEDEDLEDVREGTDIEVPPIETGRQSGQSTGQV